jgi:hypothetical protein
VLRLPVTPKNRSLAIALRSDVDREHREAAAELSVRSRRPLALVEQVFRALDTPQLTGFVLLVSRSLYRDFAENMSPGDEADIRIAVGASGLAFPYILSRWRRGIPSLMDGMFESLETAD